LPNAPHTRLQGLVGLGESIIQARAFLEGYLIQPGAVHQGAGGVAAVSAKEIDLEHEFGCAVEQDSCRVLR
jgi:hypothetical protein